ncbi:hypothetical protein MNB_SV-13-1501 [hydrothermal vent metagenome]|uniref:Uncharacterized protein n=1 Tax=hydrothermal vent metagenome TaxID=652676 RepID=A0A1W1BUJ4_9ZZZZ
MITFTKRMKEYSKEYLTESQRVRIAANQYVSSRQEDLIQAKMDGYTYSQIAEVATIEFLETNVVKTYKVTDKEGKEKEVETVITAKLIKNFCEVKD